MSAGRLDGKHRSFIVMAGTGPAVTRSAGAPRTR